MKLNETAVFIGKFQPPHIGHILTIRKLLLEYKSVIIAVTEGKPNLISYEMVSSIFKNVLAEQEVSFQKIKGAVDEGTAVLDFDFDVICSGNPEVLSLLKDKGYKTRFIERTSDNYFTGTSIRNNYINNALVNNADSIQEFKIVETNWLKPIEKVFNSHLTKLEESIINEKTIRQPLIVDKVTGAVLDGSHRFAFLLKHGFQKAPVLMVDYSDESIFVGNELSHRFKYNNNKSLNKDNIRARALNHDLLEPRTTRHFFPFRKIEIPTKLDLLSKSNENDIGFLLSSYSKDQQAKANQNYLKEIDEEIDIIEEYLKEQLELKRYLSDHIKKMLA
jgi:nicotinamide mononucleotide adenylyltransferase